MKTITLKLYEWPKEKPEGSGEYGVLTTYGNTQDWSYSDKHKAWNTFDDETEEAAKNNLNDSVLYWFNRINWEDAEGGAPQETILEKLDKIEQAIWDLDSTVEKVSDQVHDVYREVR